MMKRTDFKEGSYFRSANDILGGIWLCTSVGDKRILATQYTDANGVAIYTETASSNGLTVNKLEKVFDESEFGECYMLDDPDCPFVLSALLKAEAVTRTQLQTAKAAHASAQKSLDLILKPLLFQHRSLFLPLFYRAEKHPEYSMATVLVPDEFNDLSRHDAARLRSFVDDLHQEEPDTEPRPGFTSFVGKDRGSARRNSDFEWFSIHIPSRYLEANGKEVMRQDAKRIAAELDALDADLEKRLAQDQEAKDRVLYQSLRARFGDSV